MGCEFRNLSRDVVLGFALMLACEGAFAQKRYDLGASDIEIKIGHIVPYSGLASPYSVIGNRGRVFRQDQCGRRRQWPQDPFPLL
jgi:hypothetical protein